MKRGRLARVLRFSHHAGEPPRSGLADAAAKFKVSTLAGNRRCVQAFGNGRQQRRQTLGDRTRISRQIHD